MQGPSGASPDARAAGGVGQSQGRGRGGREDESPKYAGGEGAEEAMEQLEAAGRGFAPATVPDFRRESGIVAQDHCCGQALEPAGAGAAWAAHPCGWKRNIH